ncbi:hypothetical protein DFP73DRAFT_202274 [Morchella snyderi]|nr:hypothetical protein DFP73DRAFT_202274 [Morchella snyderi]
MSLLRPSALLQFGAAIYAATLVHRTPIKFQATYNIHTAKKNPHKAISNSNDTIGPENLPQSNITSILTPLGEYRTSLRLRKAE